MTSTGPWHRWFAWRPVRTEQYGWRWLRTVERALHYPIDIPFAPDPYWIYRPTPNNRKEVNEPQRTSEHNTNHDYPEQEAGS